MGFEEPGSSSKTPCFFTGPTFFEVLEALGIGKYTHGSHVVHRFKSSTVSHRFTGLWHPMTKHIMKQSSKV